MPQVVVSDAVVDPGAVMVVLGHAAAAATAVLASEGLAYHALDAEVIFVELPQGEEFFNDGALLIAGRERRDVAGVFQHGHRVEVSCQGVADGEEDVENWVDGKCCWQNGVCPSDTDPE